jgi:hypothetical protein
MGTRSSVRGRGSQLWRAELAEKLASNVAPSISKRPETRHQDGHQFAVDLREVLADHAGLTTAASFPAATIFDTVTARSAKVYDPTKAKQSESFLFDKTTVIESRNLGTTA